MNDLHPLIDEALLPRARWSILRTLHVGGHLGATEEMIHAVLTGEFIGVTRQWIRQQLDYLQSRKLVSVERSEIAPWRAKLERHGYDIVDYQVECLPGIQRPPRHRVD